MIGALRQLGIPVISELEYAFRHCSGRVLAITGSNGKTTTTTLCHHILAECGVDAALCGNIGRSFARTISERSYDWYVVEVSSFQLDDVVTFRPNIGIMLNITPDHLDRYDGSFAMYAKAKLRLAANMTGEDFLIYNSEDTILQAEFGRAEMHFQTCARTDADLPDHVGRPENLQGKHNALNLACAIGAAKRIGIPEIEIHEAIASYKKPPHRMERVAEIEGVMYINDSKATNTEAAASALESLERPVIWIAGGQDKGNDYGYIKSIVGGRVKTLICLGIENKKLIEAFSAEVDRIKETTSVFEAVKLAASSASSGDVVLLSPACASFDLFKNYEERGDLFRQAVHEISGK
ncbi:MAG: UDP-N-acetylmuramoyl-L-alanine--D-glutamate ligase [Bacteroidetes bacterium]|nr:MAG: UDP-N-acetylmuramoyl-L-alanine--D-glutamate ligase [Bacteroidota bacterium]